MPAGALRRRERCGLVTRGRQSLLLGSAGRQSGERRPALCEESARRTTPCCTPNSQEVKMLAMHNSITKPHPAVLGTRHSRHAPHTNIIHRYIKKARYLPAELQDDTLLLPAVAPPSPRTASPCPAPDRHPRCLVNCLLHPPIMLGRALCTGHQPSSSHFPITCPFLLGDNEKPT